MHFSALAYVGESVEDPAKYYHNNSVQTIALLDELIGNGNKLFVFSSTCATYGEPQHIPIDEGHQQKPENPYGWTKLFVERVMADYDRAYGLRFVALRYFNACGATERRTEHHDPETHLIPLILDAAAGKREHIAVFGSDYPTPDGTAIRDYIHVSDLSQAHLLAVDHLKKGGNSEFINLGNGQGFSVLEVIEAAKKVTGRDIPLVMQGRRPGDPSRLVGDSTKARELLGWNPQLTSLEQIISSAWRWYESEDQKEQSVGNT
jgi:UDP-glucose 4-epimerase